MEKVPVFGIAGLVVLVLVLVVGFASCATVPAGHVGIVTNFGAVDGTVLPAGIHVVAFWKHVQTLSIRTQEKSETADVPTKEGLTVHLDATLLFSLKAESASEIYRTVGENYIDVVVTPQFRSAMRGITVDYQAQDLYTANRAEIEQKLQTMVHDMLGPRGIVCEKVLLRSVVLPDLVKTAIEQKLAADQDAQRMEYVVKREEQEAKRRAVEAGGIAAAQKIIQSTLDDNYLRYLWLEALKVAAANPSTVIYVPTDSSGFPMFMPLEGKREPKK